MKAEKPDFCPYIFRDWENIYLEFEGMVLAFPFSDAGLHKALKHIPDITARPGYYECLNGNLLKKLTKKRLPKVKLRRGVTITANQAEVIDKLLGELEKK